MSKILISIIIAFVFSVSIFILVQSVIYSDATQEQDFFSKKFDTSKTRILVIGSSYVGMLNASHIELGLQNEIANAEVFNLARSGDKPEKRLSEIDQILSLDPKIIIYGVGYRAFSNEFFVDDEKVLPDPQAASDTFFHSLEIDFLENPKFNTLSVIREIVGIEPPNLKRTSTPFFDATLPMFKTNPSLITDKHVPDGWVRQISDYENNVQYDSLNKIISILQKNEIKFILFVTPHNLSTIDSLTEKDKQNFDKIILNLESDNNLKTYSLLHNYSKLNVWTSPDHVTVSSEGNIFNEDISKIILSESKK